MGSRLEMESHEEPWDLEEYDRASSSLLESLCNLGSLSAQFPKISGDLLGGATLTIGDVDLGIQPLRSPQMWSGPISNLTMPQQVAYLAGARHLEMVQ
jgi:hypothetical protein